MGGGSSLHVVPCQGDRKPTGAWNVGARARSIAVAAAETVSSIMAHARAILHECRPEKQQSLGRQKGARIGMRGRDLDQL